jgi:hypothetical protein
MHLTILRRRWELVECDGRELPGCWGECEDPKSAGKRIRIRKGLIGQRRAEILLHEMLHAAGWHIGEEAVEELARDMARALHRTGCLNAGDDA